MFIRSQRFVVLVLVAVQFLRVAEGQLDGRKITRAKEIVDGWRTIWHSLQSISAEIKVSSTNIVKGNERKYVQTIDADCDREFQRVQISIDGTPNRVFCVSPMVTFRLGRNGEKWILQRLDSSKYDTNALKGYAHSYLAHLWFPCCIEGMRGEEIIGQDGFSNLKELRDDPNGITVIKWKEDGSKLRDGRPSAVELHCDRGLLYAIKKAVIEYKTPKVNTTVQYDSELQKIGAMIIASRIEKHITNAITKDASHEVALIHVKGSFTADPREFTLSAFGLSDPNTRKDIRGTNPWRDDGWIIGGATGLLVVLAMAIRRIRRSTTYSRSN